jgi:hypothetical protein
LDRPWTSCTDKWKSTAFFFSLCVSYVIDEIQNALIDFSRGGSCRLNNGVIVRLEAWSEGVEVISNIWFGSLSESNVQGQYLIDPAGHRWASLTQNLTS